MHFFLHYLLTRTSGTSSNRSHENVHFSLFLILKGICSSKLGFYYQEKRGKWQVMPFLSQLLRKTIFFKMKTRFHFFGLILLLLELCFRMLLHKVETKVSQQKQSRTGCKPLGHVIHSLLYYSPSFHSRNEGQ